jgi:hypothetical protein
VNGNENEYTDLVTSWSEWVECGMVSASDVYPLGSTSGNGNGTEDMDLTVSWSDCGMASVSDVYPLGSTSGNENGTEDMDLTVSWSDCRMASVSDVYRLGATSWSDRRTASGDVYLPVSTNETETETSP